MGRFSSLLLFILLAACAQVYPFVWATDLPNADGATVIGVGDTLTVLVKNQDPLSGEFLVRANGRYVQPLVGEVAVAGLTPAVASVVSASRYIARTFFATRAPPTRMSPSVTCFTTSGSSSAMTRRCICDGSTIKTGRWAPGRPMPTKAHRKTDGCVLKTASHGIV